MAPTDKIDLEQALERAALAVADHLRGVIGGDGSRVHDAMRYAALGPGKRLRPFLVMESAVVHGGLSSHALRVGSALECVHCYSLVHDDLPAMDNDDVRRGLPTVHRTFDEATAILAGDGLLTLAFEILADAETHPDAEVRVALIAALAKASGASGMVSGQMLDIEAETRNFASLAEISAMQNKKTGALFGFAVEAGAIIAGADPAGIRPYADYIGLAFQITDDILDVESDAATLGKATQKDKTRGKATFVDFLGLSGAKEEAQRLSDAAIHSLSRFDSRADHLRAVARFVINRRK